MSDHTYRFGEYVIYKPPYKETAEIGRVIEDCGDSVRVCYHSGCTAAMTPKEYLIPLDNWSMIPNLGLHRFDEHCEHFQEGVCESYCPDKAGRDV